MGSSREEVTFGAQQLVRGQDFIRKRGSLLILDKQGGMACLECGQRWRAVVRDSGFYAGRVACPRCGAGTGRKPQP